MDRIFKPMGLRILVKPSKTETTKSGLIIVDNESSFAEGTVMEVGTGEQHPAGTLMPVAKVGNTVLYPAKSGVEIVVNGEKLKLLNESEILGYFSPFTV